jgi:predicted chitinase
MAEKVEIDIPGVGLIEAKNAATEATLLEILDVLRGTQKDNNKNADKTQKSNKQNSGPAPQGGGGGGGGIGDLMKGAAGASKGLNLLNNAGKAAGIGMNVLGRSAGMAVGGVGKLAGGAVIAAGAAFTLGKVAMSAAEGMTNLIQEMAEVGDSTTAAAQTMRHIPIVGGLLAGVFGAVAAASENVVASYQKSASVGATFNGSVEAMSRAAGGAGMTLDQFAGLLAQNGENLAVLGGTTEQGAKQFAQLAKGIQQSGVGADLQRLGFTTEQINGSMAKYIGMMGRSGALQGMTTQQLIASSGEYMKQLDGLAKITGESRQALEDERKAMMAEAKVAAALQHLSAEAQGEMMTYIQSFPKAQRAAVADMLATGNTTTEAAIQFQSLLPGAAAQTMEFSRQIQAGGRISKDTMNQALNNASREAKESARINAERFKYDESIQQQGGAVFELASRKTDAFGQAMGEQAKATEKANLAENLTKAKQKLAEFSNNFQIALANSGALDGLMTVFSSLANLLLSTVVPVFTNYIVPVITNAVVPALQAVFAIATKIASGLSTLLMPAVDAVAAAFGPGSGLGGTVQFIDGLLNAVFPPLAAIVQGVITIFEGLMAGVGFLIGPIDRLFGSFNFLEGGTDTLTKIILTAGDYIGTAFKALGFLLGGVIDVTGSVVRWFGDLIKQSADVSAAFKFIGTAVDMLRTYFSPEGFKAIYASIKEFFTNGISDFIGSFKDAALSMFSGLLQLIGKIPGLGKLADAGKEMEKEIEDRKKAREDAAKERKTEINQLHKAAADAKTERDKKIEQRAATVKQDSKTFSEKKVHLQAMGALNKEEKEAQEKKNEEAKGQDPSVSLANPIQMLKTFAAQQKSAFTQEAKALDDKEKARAEMKAASDEYSKAIEAAGKATTAEEKKAAEDRITAAEARQKKAQEAQEKANEAVTKATERMKLAKEGKDPGAVAEGKPKEEKKTETGKPEAAKPATSEPAKPQGAGAPQAAMPAINQDVQKNLELVKAALQKQGMTDPKYIAATLGNVMKETGGKSISENMDYSKTSNERIKKIFGSRAAGKTDQELDAIKKDPKQMGEMMYGSGTKMGQQMGNTEPGDGWKYRGRGFIQLTGKSNYAAASKAIYGDNRLVDNPDLVNDPAVAAEVSAWYMKKGQARMATSLGIDTKNMSQDQANLLATSQIAGGDIRKKGAIGQELSGKVDKFASSGQIQAIAGAAGGPATATATAKPPSAATPTTAAEANKARADAAATDPRRTDKPAEAKPPTAVGTNVPPKVDETQTPQSAMQTLIKDGIMPTTIAFQNLVKNGITPMLTGVQVKADKLDKGTVKPEDSLKPGEELMKSLPKVAETMAASTRSIADTAKLPQTIDTGAFEQTLAASTRSIADTAKLPQTPDQSLAIKEALTATASNIFAGSTEMISGFKTTAIDLSSSLINGLDFTTSDLMSSLTTSFQDGLSSSLDLFNTEFSNNFEIVGEVFESTFDKLDPFTENILSAAGHISDAENNIAENQKNIALAQNELADADITDDRREQLNDFIQAAQENIGMQQSSIAYNKDSIDTNIMARAESPRSEIIAQKEKEMQDKIAMEQQQAEIREKLKNEEMVAMSNSANSQNMASGDSSDLNTALRELIAINKRTADLNEKQLSVQSSLSGDLFA